LILALAFSLLGGFAGLFVLWRRAEAERTRADAQLARAEDERSRTEAGYEVSRSALADIIHLAGWGVQSPFAINRNELVASLRSARDRIFDLARLRPDDREVSGLLGTCDLFLGRNLELDGKSAEALPIYIEGLAEFERILRKDSDDRAAMYDRWRSLVCIARAYQGLGQIEESLRHWEEAVSVGEQVFPVVGDENTMAECRVGLARLLHQQGQHQLEGSLLEGNLRLLIAMSAKGLLPDLERTVAQSFADFVRLDPGSNCDAITAQELVQVVEECLSSTPASPWLSRQSIRKIVALLVDSLSVRCAGHRHAGQMVEARLMEDRMLALGRDLVSRHPDEPSAHLALSEAYVQASKNAWQPEDDSAIERALRQAVESARQATRLDPSSEQAQRCVDRLLPRLVMFDQRRASTSAAPSRDQ
jgi:tetratricopeptide (TPR) repeat protein